MRAPPRRPVSIATSAVVAFALALAVGCGKKFPEVPLQPGSEADFAPPAAVEVPGLPNDPPAPLVLFPGDVLRLRTQSVDPMDVPDLAVDSTGHVHLPLAGDVEVGGLGLAEAEKRVEQALSQRDRFVHVTLLATSLAGHRVTVIGSVLRPGVYEVKPDARLAEVVGLAGGLKSYESEGESYELADVEGARLVRAGIALPVSFGRALQGSPQHNVRVRGGDVVYVPAARGRRIVILGDVHSPKALLFRPGIRLAEALASAGGTTKDADNADIRVVRGPLSSPRVYHASLKALINGQARDVELAPGDIVFVTEHWLATTSDVVNRLTPALAAVAVGAALTK